MQVVRRIPLTIFAFSTVLLMGFGTARAHADSKVELVNDQYVESFIPNAKVSGNLLVGLKWADDQTTFDPNKIMIEIPAQAKGHKACVEINSQDGRYSAQNLYFIKADAADTAQFETKTNFQQNLSKYNAQSVAVAVRLIDSCDSPEVGTLLPASFKSDTTKSTAPRKLNILVNAEPHKVVLRLTDHGKEIGHFNGCTTAGTNVSVAFSSSCEVVLDKVNTGSYDLEVKVSERFDRTTKHFPVMLD